MGEKCWQEFYCHRCPDGGTYIMVKLNMAINYTVVVVCPSCGSKHERTIEKGQIFDRGKGNCYKEEICPPKSACSKEPHTKRMRESKGQGARNGEVIKSEEDLIRDSTMREVWLERFGG